MSAQTEVPPLPYQAYRAPLPQPSYVGSLSYYHYEDNHPTHSFDNSSRPLLSKTNYPDTYMNPTFPQPPPQFSFRPSSHHGVKRSAPDLDEEFERSSHISTQFKKLRLNNQRGAPALEQANPADNHTQTPTQHQLPNYGSPAPPYPTPDLETYPHPPILPSDDFMPVDDTPHKIYITDLDSEIASIEAAEQPRNQLFLPDFEKQIGAIPDHVLRSNQIAYSDAVADRDSGDNTHALVLYRDPASLSVPEEEDMVRKVVQESRRGLRERLRREQQKERETAHMHLGLGADRRGSPLGTVPEHIAGFSLHDGPGTTQRMNHDMDEGDAMDFD